MTTPELTKMKKTIESLSKGAQIGLFKLLDARPDVVINENRNGSFINLSTIKGGSLNMVREYLNYIAEQKESIAELDEKRKMLEARYFSSKQKSAHNYIDECEIALSTE